ncbi:MAG: flagellar hook protein FlgE [Acidobacteriaceae bacterium]|nr:flagellar hook protein FlgE [Acidobacteriaceae bacterium]
MSSTFSVALSALKAQSEAIDITGNNLANMNTDGFKGSTVQFKDLFSEYLGDDTGFQLGLGVGAPINTQVFTQGGIQSSTSPMSAAIEGNGFFVVASPSNQQLYTRDGNFQISSSGALQTQTGENVQGWVATATGINTNAAPGDITLPTGTVLPPVATKNMSMNANLDATGTVGSSTGTFSVPIQVVDSLGATHILTATFTKSATPNTWTYDVTVPGGDLIGGTAGTQVSVLSTPGTLTFNNDGTMSPTNTSPVPMSITNLADGAANLNINWNLFNPDGSGMITQYDETSNLASSSQDGEQAAQLNQVALQNGGQVVASYSNGEQKVVAQLALAAIQNPDSLQNVGNNNFATTTNTATPAIGAPQTGGRGQILGNSIEGSNVDMATEFTNLIVYQSAYQASSRVITTADQITQDLLNLIH